ncbi:MAG: UDP-N-acetylmuramoyl-L-alanyl-D-glutamate--2,6-diaminopimelate ligase [Chloroflexi bacterium]|nr:UDP-N-acetylmuramoyl-L-alanyl-D-glutamate--2,6-diaminopimelate ligase [Chloroflexota bacterium]MBU1662405.1 UDP-N-acetylmuramoyl-L-alanyl-D-glutamate--2,6-diaminopimelate ligase [Chloroflexota bacterium]
MHTLSSLLQYLPKSTEYLASDIPVTGIVLDSRQAKPGNIFVALTGINSDGHLYIPDAIQRDAAAIVGSQPMQGLPVPYLRVDDTRRALACLSAAFFDFPARKLTVIGVTGTDGKTTTANLIFHILQAADIRAGMISTVNAVIGGKTLDTGFHVTTPEAPDVQRYLAQMAAAGLTHVVLEATSHGLAQQRVAACDFDLGVVTNITHEHLDFHGSYEAYLAAKGLLLTSLAETPPKPRGNFRTALVNRDDSSYPYLLDLISAKGQSQISIITYGLHPEAGIRAADITHTPKGLQFTAIGSDFRIPISTSLLGDYNVSNILAAIAVTVAGLGVDADAVREGIAALKSIPGRMETFDLGQDFQAIVDFAHTPNALRRVLQAARPMTPGRVIAVFGSAGLRDREKRRMMAEISAELADLTVLTAEDPRTESLNDILAEMAAGAESRVGVEGETFWRVPDRGDAIRFAIAKARLGDMVLSCGKGHEQSMCFGTVEYPWDDRIAMQAALAEYLGLDGPKMPYLPTQKQVLT